MAQKKSPKIIKTDKWQIAPTGEQRQYLLTTVEVYRRLCRFLVTVICSHWHHMGGLGGNDIVPVVEKLIHRTAKNPNPKYLQIDRAFHKFPSYLRRAAIMFVYGQVSSYMTRYRDWQTGNRSRRDAKPPVLNSDAGCYPVLYPGQCYKLHGVSEAEIKVFTGKDWIWIRMPITSVRKRHLVSTNQLKSPSLIINQRACHLSVPFECHPQKVKGSGVVVAVDLGINTTATVAVVRYDGTVIHREFIHPGRDIDRRDQRLKSISRKASKTMGKGGKLHKGFCSNAYRKCQNINKQIGHIVSKRITQIAQSFQADAVVFEKLKGWKPKGGRKRSTLKQRFHNWLKSLIADLTQQKWTELGGKTLDVIAAYTSKLAYDGSGIVQRDKHNYALAKFPSGKRYNCDLSAVYNIAARGIIKLTCRKDSEGWSGKSSRHSPRSWACLCDLWKPQVSPN